MNLPSTTQKTLMDYGLLNKDQSFSSKLSSGEITQFLNGGPLSATSGQLRLTFQIDPLTKDLSVEQSTLERSLSYIEQNSHSEVLQFVRESPSSETYLEKAAYQRKAYLRDPESGALMEFDFLKQLPAISKQVLQSGDLQARARYRSELFKLKNFLFRQMKQRPQNAAELKAQANLVGKELGRSALKSAQKVPQASSKVTKVAFEKDLSLGAPKKEALSIAPKGHSARVSPESQSRPRDSRRGSISQVQTGLEPLKIKESELLNREPFKGRRR